MPRTSIISDLGRDTRLALRLLLRRKAFAGTALLTLALGLGAPTAIFSVVHAVLLRPLPYPDADRIVRFRIEARTPRGPIAFDALPVSTALEWAGMSSTLDSVAVYNDAARTLTTTDGPVRLIGVAATPNLFALLGTRPLAGRTFESADRDAQQVVLSHTAWQRYFDGDASAIGALATLDGLPHRIVGVMPPGFEFPSPETSFWVPVLLSAGGTRGMVLPAIGRLKPDASVAAVLEEGRRLLASEGTMHEERTLVVRTLQDQMVGPVRRVLWVLMAAVALVSVIATVNIALLLLTQGASRAREFSIRLALGAARGRLVRQVAVEGVVLAALGGCGGLVFAALFVPMLIRIAPPEVPRLHQAQFDPQVLAFTAGLIVVASLTFAILSAGRVVTGDAVRALGGSTAESRLTAAGVSRRRLNVLAAAELALAVVLLVGAGLLLRSFVRLVLIDQGFDSRGAVAAQVTLPSSRYPSPEARMAFHARLLASLRQQRGVAHAGVITAMPNRQPTGRFCYDPDGITEFPDPFTIKVAEVRMATDGFLEAMGIPLVAGRWFTAADADGAEPVIVVSDEMARAHFGDGPAVGRMLYSHTGNRRIVGVVRTVRPASSVALQHNPSVYLPLRQSLDVFQQFGTMSIVVRGDDPEALAAAVRAIVRTLDPELAVFNVRALDDEVASLVAGPRFSATVLALFAVVALVMAAVGVYGVMTYTVGVRTREIGVRAALGATQAQILQLILRDGLLVVVAGLGAGLLASVWLNRTLTGLLFEVTPADPMALGTVTALLSAVGLVAIYLPARRATRLSALTALRED